jgi:membrane-bound lytic murein transglycosylase D
MARARINALSLPALVIALSAATTHFLMAAGFPLTDADNYPAWENLPLHAPLQLGHQPLQPHPEYTLAAIAAAATPAIPEVENSADIWERMRSGFGLQPDISGAVQTFLKTYRTHPHHVEQILRRGEPYLYYILSRIEAHELPAELALLPVVESAFDPFARSPAGATGIWQFMSATATHVGLQQDWWYDGRRDIVDATEAALEYLGELNQRFDGDWLLTLAAYNAGSARVRKAIRHNRSRGEPVDFWHLPLPRETRNYVPKLLALRQVITNPEASNITLPALANTRYFSVVDTRGQIDLQVAARLAGTSVDELRLLNPGLIRSITPPALPHTLVIPMVNEQLFRERLAHLPADQRVQSVEYRIRWGDSLSTIAQHFRTTVAKLRQANHLKDNEIYAGRRLIVPMVISAEDRHGEMHAALM